MSVTSSAVRPRQEGGRLGRSYRGAAHANAPRVDETVEADQQCRAEQDGPDPGPCRDGCARRRKAKQEGRDPAQAGGPEQEVQDSKPDGGDLVDQRDKRVGIAIAKQRSDDETDRKQEQRSAQGLEAAGVMGKKGGQNETSV